MLLFGHLGIGNKIASPWSRQLPKPALLLGTILPDLIDKPVYYLMSWSYGLYGSDLGLISGSRTFGHTALFLLLLTSIAYVRKSKSWAALALGVATHLLLDNLNDTLADVFLHPTSSPEERSGILALLFPFYRPYFSVTPFQNAAEHVKRAVNHLSIVTEVGGIGILLWDFWKNRHRSEILKARTQVRDDDRLD